MQPITAYVSTDGKIFASTDECVEWEERQKWKEKISAFMVSPQNLYKGAAQQSVIVNSIIAWEMFKASQGTQ